MKMFKLFQRDEKLSTMKCKMISRTTFCIFILLLSYLINPTISQGENELCSDNDCTCNPSGDTDLIDVICKCSPNRDPLRIADKSNPRNTLYLPENAASLQLERCHHVEIFAKTFNHAKSLKNVTITDSAKTKLHPKMYEIGSGTSPHFTTFELTNVRHLEVQRNAFSGISIDGSFVLTDVFMERIPSLAFDFDNVNEFTILKSRIDRIAMWGIKPKKCNSFSILGGSRLYSLATNAFELECNKFMLAYNTFDSLLDASLNVKSGLIDVQGNTFESLTGKPFISLEPATSNEQPARFVFRQNKFKADPTLPFNALAMPAFDLVKDQDCTDCVEDNHFLCDCNKVGWFIAAITHEFDSDIIANGRGSLEFLKRLYDTSGQCLECDLRTCEPKDGHAFRNFAQAAVTKVKGRLICSASRQPLKSQRPGANHENSIDEANQYYSEEEDLANVKTKDWSSELLKDTQHSSSSSLRVKFFHEILNISIIICIICIFMPRRIFL